MARLKALCAVAHPDDCIIFAWPFIEYANQFDWTILYLTYSEQEPRAKEIKKFWDDRNIPAIFLGYIDTYKDMENNKLSFDVLTAAWQIAGYVKDYDLLLTHDRNGDYGHIHHKFVHDRVNESTKPKVYFANQQEQNFECRRTTPLNLDDLPLHREVISEFDDIETGRYLLTEDAKELLNGLT
jgi:LmbE family N-acetylglucosaminyl deacetylase